MISKDQILELIDQVEEAKLEQLHTVVKHIAEAGDGARETREEFSSLAKEWHDETRFLSSIHKMSIHPAYQRIIGMGYAAVPLILKELKDAPDYWFWALAAITGEDPVPVKEKGNLDAMAEAWLKWGEERGYINGQ
jgi:hypothetical protein